MVVNDYINFIFEYYQIEFVQVYIICNLMCGLNLSDYNKFNFICLIKLILMLCINFVCVQKIFLKKNLFIFYYFGYLGVIWCGFQLVKYF